MDFSNFLGSMMDNISDNAELVFSLMSLIGGSAVVWMQKRYHWFDRACAVLFKVGKKEKEIAVSWKAAVHELNALAPEDAKLLSFRIGSMPRVEKVSAERLEWLDDPKVQALVKHQETNKPHGFVVGEVSNHIIEFVQSDYAVAEAARAAGIKPPVLSSNAIIFCPATYEVLVHLRGNTRTYPHAVHFIGGNYEPSRAMEKYDDKDKDSPLRMAALREIEEETGLKLDYPEKPVVILSEEKSTGFIQCVYAGLSVTSKMRDKIEDSLEGGLAWVSFDELVEFFESGMVSGQTMQIVPSSALAIMMWLKMGAPDQSLKTPCQKKAVKAYEKILPHMSGRLAKI